MPTALARKKAIATKTTATKTRVSVAAKKGPAKVPTLPSVVVANGKHKPKSREKLVRDTFTMPRSDFDLITLLKERALTFRRPTKKSELLRAGLQALAALNQQQLQDALDGLPLPKSERLKKLPPPSKAFGVE